MHFAFIPYGARTELELLFRDLEAQKYKMVLKKKGEKDKFVFIPGQVRALPFGVYEYIFVKEMKDIVLNIMMGNTAPNRFGLPKMFMAIFRKTLKLKPIPKYEKKTKFLWTIENISIIPIGIREDADLIEPKEGEYKGWVHEAI